jgi:predicted Zn-dependent protease
VLLELGDLRWEQGDHPRGLELFQQAVSACPSDSRLRLRLARALAASEDPLGAAFELREAKHLVPLDPEIDRELLAIEGQRRLNRRKRRHARRLAA